MKSPMLKELPPSPAGRSGWPWMEETKQVDTDPKYGGNWPRISIVTPSYNQSQFIEETIRSVLLQGYPDFEYIISEDCSTDNSLEIIRKYSSWVKLIVGDQNRGMSHAINKGFKVATGDIITWISSDDIYLPGAFKEIGARWSSLRDHGAVVGRFNLIDENSVLQSSNLACYLPHSGPIDLSIEPIENWRLHQVSTFYIQSALENVGRYVREDLRHNMDREIIYRIANQYKVLTLDAALASFRIQGNSKSWNPDNMLKIAVEYAGIQDLFLNDNPDENRIRRRIAKCRTAVGYVKFAKYSPSIWRSYKALLIAPYHYPQIVLRRDYYKALAKVFGILSLIRFFINIFRTIRSAIFREKERE